VLALCCAIALLPLIQLVPLPPWIWVNLLRREELAKVFTLVGNEAPWMPISVSPPATWLSCDCAVLLNSAQLNLKNRLGDGFRISRAPAVLRTVFSCAAACFLPAFLFWKIRSKSLIARGNHRIFHSRLPWFVGKYPCFI
jgi:hypothetical protein